MRVPLNVPYVEIHLQDILKTVSWPWPGYALIAEKKNVNLIWLKGRVMVTKRDEKEMVSSGELLLESTFIAERAEQPDEPIPDPPSYRDKWRRRW